MLLSIYNTVTDDQRARLEQAILTLTAQRAILGDDVVEASVAALRQQLAQLSPHPVNQQRKQVTVLFADIPNFTAMSEMMDAEDVTILLNRFWQRIDHIITTHRGRIDKHMGDGVMALWGVDTAQEDDPEQAVRAALAMQQAIRHWSTEPGIPAGMDFAMRIGLNTGPVLLGQVGSTGEFTALGDTVNTASRLEASAPVGGVLISHDTYRHVRGIFDVQPQNLLAVKGKSGSLRVYVVQRVRPRAFRVGTRGVEGIETQMIGREHELQQLQEALYRTIHQQKLQLLTIVGDAGIGKSRLLYEFEKWIDPLPETVLYFKGRADQQMRYAPYALMRDLISYRLEIQDSDAPQVARHKIETAFATILGENGLEKAHFIGQLLGFDFSESPYIRGVLDDTRQIRDRAFFYIGQFFAAATRANPVLILLEDIHWADDNSLDLVEHLARHVPEYPVLILALTRTNLFEHRPAWKERYPLVALNALTREESSRLVQEILRLVPTIPSILQETVIINAAGNPFYMEELIKMMIENGVIMPGAEVWRVHPGRLAEVQVPPTLTGVLQARLDRLSLPERELLQRASVVGRIFWDGAVTYLTQEEPEQPGEPVNEGLTALQGKELIFRRQSPAFAGTAEFMFKHAILHEVTYESVLKSRRRRFHERAAAWLVEQSGRRVDEYAGAIAHHYEQAGLLHEAIGWYERAARQAQTTYAHTVAANYYQHALELVNNQGQQVPIAQQCSLLSGLGISLRLQARYTEATGIFHTLFTLAQSVGDVFRQVEAYDNLARIHERYGEYQQALYLAEQMETLAHQSDTLTQAQLAAVLYRRGWTLYRLGEMEQALTIGHQCFTLCQNSDDLLMKSQSRNLIGVAYVALGRFDLAEPYIEQALEFRRQIGNRSSTASMLNNLGETARLQGNYEKAVPLLEEALAMAQEIGNRAGVALYRNNLAGARLGLGDYDAVLTDVWDVLQLAEKDWFFQHELHRFLALAYLGLGQDAEALPAAQQALVKSLNAGDKDGIGKAWLVLGQTMDRLGKAVPVEAKQGEIGDAAACFRQSETIFMDKGMEASLARLYRIWGWSERRQGHQAEGDALWQKAYDLFSRLEMKLELARMDEPEPLL
ncbi:MAG: tetratricopeptide repeat protein [Chloroflexi bacterium]|nr:tetratricopeptide repeat protein [Chloroflexota bacterium]